MGWAREKFLDAAMLVGVAAITSGVIAAASPEWYQDLSDQFNEGGRVGGRNTSLVAAATSIEPTTAFMIGGALLAYGFLVPKNP